MIAWLSSESLEFAAGIPHLQLLFLILELDLISPSVPSQLRQRERGVFILSIGVGDSTLSVSSNESLFVSKMPFLQRCHK